MSTGVAAQMAREIFGPALDAALKYVPAEQMQRAVRSGGAGVVDEELVDRWAAAQTRLQTDAAQRQQSVAAAAAAAQQRRGLNALQLRRMRKRSKEDGGGDDADKDRQK